MARKASTPTKICTKTGVAYPATPEFFYRDKSQKDGLSPWSKEAERAYNKAYRASLKATEANRKRDIANDDALATFEKGMKSERVVRKGRVVRDNDMTRAATTTTRGRARAKA
jgi:hypothetical protein